MERDENLMMARHSMAHVLAKAIMEIYPKTKLTIGPAIDDGFYYDIDLDENLSPDHFGQIEKKMQEILNKGEEFRKEVVSKEKALEIFNNNPYKTELINELPEVLNKEEVSRVLNVIKGLKENHTVVFFTSSSDADNFADVVYTVEDNKVKDLKISQIK